MNFKEKMKSISWGIIGLIFLLTLITLGSGVVQGMPDNAKVIVSDIKGEKLYHAPPVIEPKCFGKKDLTEEVFFAMRESGQVGYITAKKAENQGYKPCDICRNQGGFMEDKGWFVKVKFLELIGKNPSRWTKDGEWNW